MRPGQGVASAGLLRAQSSVVGQNLGLERPHGGPWVVWTPWGCGNSPLGRGRAWGHVLVRPWGVRGGGALLYFTLLYFILFSRHFPYFASLKFNFNFKFNFELHFVLLYYTAESTGAWGAI